MRARILALIGCLLISALCFGQTSKQKITRGADLPRFQYSITGKVEDMIKSDEAFRSFAAEVRKNVESVLRNYEVEDAGTRRDLLNILVSLDIIENRDKSARERLAQIKELEEKPAAKALSGLVAGAVLDAREKIADHNSPEYRQAAYASIKSHLNSLPFELVQNDLKVIKARAEIFSESVLVGQIQASLDPVVEKTGMLSGELAHGLPGIRMNLTEVVPLKETLLNAIGAYFSAHAKDKKDIWTDRDVILDPGKKYKTVNVGVWDGGVDLSIFQDRLVKDRTGQPAVLAYDLESRKTTGSLYPLNSEQTRRYLEMKKELKGLSDLQANVESAEAAELRQRLAKLKPEQVRPFIEEIQFLFEYTHGSHVAGILMAGNPYARLATGRLTFEWKMIPDPCPSQAQVDRDISALQDFVGFFKSNRVRVVNMSWGSSVKGMEDALEKCAIGKDVEERKIKARAWFDLEKESLQKSMNSAPDILFVAAAGNSNSDSTFDEFIPSSFKLPNLLTVGAVDKAGDEASFTSYGPTVVVHANGHEVESYIPGRDRLKLSGTSMASPNVANLAAKIFAVNPRLTPAQVIEIIRTTAEKTSDGRRNLINPKKAVAAAQAP